MSDFTQTMMPPGGLDYLAIAGTLQCLAGKCSDEILQPVLDWLEDQ